MVKSSYAWLRIHGGAPTHRYPDPKDRYCHIYFEALELATGEIKRRFDREDLCY